jgi:hypothetical protein
MIYTKQTLELYLRELLGSYDLVDQWWHSSNKAFNGKTPIEIYHSGEEGRVRIADYILSHANGQW